METIKQTDPRTHVATTSTACAVVLNHPAVHEAAFVLRADRQGRERVVAYVVPAVAVQPDTLIADLERDLPRQQHPDRWVLLSAIPRKDDGDLDLETLAGLEVLDEDLVARWKNALRAQDGVADIEVLALSRHREMDRLHRADLLPGGFVRGGTNGPSPTAAAAHAQTPLHGVSALAYGGPLLEPPDAPATVCDALVRAADRYPAHGIEYVRKDGSTDAQSYPQLLADAGQVLAGLRRLGLEPGAKVLFQLTDQREFLTAFWACVLGGMVPALVSVATGYASSDPGAQRVFNAWQLLDRPLILCGDAAAAEIRAVLGAAAANRVASLRELPAAGAETEATPALHCAAAEDLALILFTSGSTGIPKGVMQTHRSLLCMARGTAQQNGFSADDVTLNWMPLDHVGAISFLHVMAVTLGCRQLHVAPDHILDEPLRWLDLMAGFKASISWGPNFAFKLINERARDMRERSWDLSCMRFLVSAGEQIVSNTVQRCLELLARYGLPPDALRPAFGMSETCSGITWSDGRRRSANGADARYVDLGAPIPSARLRIVDADDRLLNEGDIGRLQLSGPSVTRGYYNNPEANAKAFTADGWFDTGDLGFLRDGRLTLTGREKDEIIVNGVNYVAAEIEAAVDAVAGVDVSFSVACAVRSAGSDTDELAIFCVPGAAAKADAENLAALLKSLRTAVATTFGVNPTYLIPVTRADIPKTSIGKIQRTQLKRRFEAGEFDAAARQADLLTGVNAVPEWFYRREWRPRAAPQREPRLDDGVTVVLVDAGGLGESVRVRLADTGVACVAVEAGAEFRALGGERYGIDPACPEHYRRLLQDILRRIGRIGRIVHCFSCDPPAAPIATVAALAQAQQRGLYSLLHLVQALATVQGDTGEVALYMIGRGTQVTAADDAADCTHAAALGLLKSIPYEMNWLKCRHIDLPQTPCDADVDCVSDELRALSKDTEVAYRGGRRLVWQLLPIVPAAVDVMQAAGEPIRRGGIYLITGGLGGVGAFLARTLVREYGIKPVLIGTTALPPRAEWPRCLEQGGPRAERIRQYQEIEAFTADCVYAAADVADLERLRAIVADAEARWGDRIAGIFHLAVAGDVAAHWADMERFAIRNETVESLDGLMRAKVYGTWALYRIADARPGCIVVPFGSVLGVFGAAYFSGYCAVHTFQHNYALLQRYRAGVRSFNICWAVWEDLGLSRSDPVFAKDFYRATGYCVIPPQLGFDCLLAGLWRDLPEFIVGLDGSKPQVARHIAARAQPLRELTAFCVPRSDAVRDAASVRTPSLTDGFGTASRCELAWMPVLPRLADGAVDRQTLAAGRATGAAAPDTAPQTEMERQLAAIWRDILPLQHIGIRDSFFQLGGNSLGATRLMSRIRQEFHIALDMRELFAHATVHALAALLQRKRAETPQPAAPACDDPLAAGQLLERVDAMSDSEVAALLRSLQSGSAAQ